MTRNKFPTIHGDSFPPTRAYNSWKRMKACCSNSKSIHYKYYGGRGISYCKRWEKYKNFKSDMGEPPFKDFTLDRIDNNKDYCKQNCRWVSRKQQARNRRCNVKLTLAGVTRLLVEWEELLGLNRRTIRKRLEMGWPIHKVLDPKVKNNRLVYTYKGITLSLKEWAVKLDKPYRLLKERLRILNWTIEQAFTLPKGHKRK